MLHFEGLTWWTIQALVIDFVIIIALFVSLKLIKGWLSNLHTNDEIAKRDNFAFGISFAAGLAGLAIVLSGVSSGAFADSLWLEAMQMLGYGLLAIALIKLGHSFQDRVALTKVSLHDEIVKGNVTAAFVEFGHVVSVAIVVRSALIWVLTAGWLGVPIIVAAYVSANVIMLLVSYYLAQHCRRSGFCLQQLILDNNLAVGIRYAGFLLGAGLALTAATGIAPYDADYILLSLLNWTLAGLACVISFALLHHLTLKVLLTHVDIADEVILQKNIGVAVISAACAFAIGITMVSLLGS